MRYKLLLINCLLTISGLIYGQEESIVKSKSLELPKYIHDFGVIKQEDGAVEYTFNLVNKAGKRVLIYDVEPECSCTEPKWTEDFIQSQEKGFITAGYKSDVYPGEFEKLMKVYTSLDTFELKIKGKVIPKPLSEIEKEYPFEFGALRFKKDVFGMKNVFDHQIKEVDIPIYNRSKNAVIGLRANNLPSYIKIEIPDKLEAESVNLMKVSFNGKIVNDYGYVTDYIELIQNDTLTHEFAVIANINPYVEKTDKHPKLQIIGEKEFDFGKVKQDSIVNYNMTLKNTGDGDLSILKVKPACSCIQSSIQEKMILSPGQTTKLTLYFDSKNRSGRTKKTTYIYSNDPHNTAQIVKMQGVVIDEEE